MQFSYMVRIERSQCSVLRSQLRETESSCEIDSEVLEAVDDCCRLSTNDLGQHSTQDKTIPSHIILHKILESVLTASSSRMIPGYQFTSRYQQATVARRSNSDSQKSDDTSSELGVHCSFAQRDTSSALKSRASC